MPLQKVDSIELSYYILAKSKPMNHLKLQKLAYFVEAYHLAYFDKSLIDDNFEAWLHGPVSRKLWNHFKPISKIYTEITLNREIRSAANSFKKKIANDQLELIDDVLEEFGDKTAYHLECLTHSHDPWQIARKGYADDDNCEVKIDKKNMKDFYKKQLYRAP